MNTRLSHAARCQRCSSARARRVDPRCAALHRRSGLHRKPPPPGAVNAAVLAALSYAARAGQATTVTSLRLPGPWRRACVGPPTRLTRLGWVLRVRLRPRHTCSLRVGAPSRRMRRAGAQCEATQSAPTGARVTQPRARARRSVFRHRSPVANSLISRLPNAGGVMRAAARARAERHHVAFGALSAPSRARRSRAFGCVARGTDAAR